MARSPNYPKLNLSEAIERVKQVYNQEHLHVADKAAVAQDLGYKGLNGSSARVISALKHYGLLEEPERDKVRVSDDAMTILELPSDAPDRTEALQRSAFTPQILADLQETYDGSPPKSDVNIRHYLLRKKFLPGAADEVIRLYRDNLQLIADATEEYTDSTAENDSAELKTPIQPTYETAQKDASFADASIIGTFPEQKTPVPSTTVLQFQVSKNSAARIELTGEVTQEAIERLALILDAQKLVFPTESEFERLKINQTSEKHATDIPRSE